MPITIAQIEAEVLKLPEQAPVELLDWLMRSLAETAAIEPALADAWTQEAVRRDEEMESAMSLVFLRKKCLRT
jgi:hypothetical protein